MKKLEKTIAIATTGAIIVGSALFPKYAQAQKNQNISSNKQVTDLYKDIENNQNHEQSEKDLEDAMRRYLYLASGQTIQAYPTNGYDCIIEKNGKHYLRFAQTGSQFSQFNAEVKRDWSTTWAGLRGLSKEMKDYNLDSWLEAISLSRGIDVSKINLIYSPNNEQILDFVTPLKGRSDVVTHKLPRFGDYNTLEQNIIGHILIPPGTDNLMPLNSAVRIISSLLDQTESSNKNSGGYQPPPQTPPDKSNEVEVLRAPNLSSNNNVVTQKDLQQKNYVSSDKKMGIFFQVVLNEKIIGAGGFYQGKFGGVEAAYFNLPTQPFDYENVVEEKKQTQIPSITGVSKLTQKGTADLRMYAAEVSFLKSVGQYAYLKGGVRASFLSEKYLNKDKLETWFDNKGTRLEYDKNEFAEQTENFNQVIFNPTIGAGVFVGPLNLGLNFTLPLIDFKDNKYIQGQNDFATSKIKNGSNFKSGPVGFDVKVGLNLNYDGFKKNNQKHNVYNARQYTRY